jgi:hypothetical protein
MKISLYAFLTMTCFLLAMSAGAHQINMAVLKITLIDQSEVGYSYDVEWTTTGAGFNLNTAPVFSKGCEQFGLKRTAPVAVGLSEFYSIRCDESLAGTSVSLEPEDSRLQQVLLVFEGRDSLSERFFSRTSLPVRIPASETQLEQPKSVMHIDFLYLGIEHMILGVDHVLFVISLLMLTGLTRKIILTITGFTLGHSITLYLAANDVLTLPEGPVEALIALSIVYMVSESIRVRNGARSLFVERPIVVSSGFGLLHGLGFAGALDELGLSEQVSFVALMLFNVGLELAQLLVVAIVFALVTGLRHLEISAKARPAAALAGFHLMYLVCTYAIGGLAGFWFVERLSQIV